jgi:hypothetical protein
MKWIEYNSEIIEIKRANPSITQKEIAKKILGKCSFAELDSFRRYVSRLLSPESMDEMIVENVRYKKEKQNAQDRNRIQNKAFREYARVENAVEEYGKELTRLNKEYGSKLSKIKFPVYKAKSGNVGVLHLTDLHGNELINLPHNKYDFHVLSKRLKKHVAESLRYFEFHDVNKVLIAFTGDLLNSDRRLDELLNQSTNRAKATVIMIHLLTQAISEVRTKYPVSVVSVLGNESRVGKEMTFSGESLSDNYDFTIVAQLAQIFKFSGVKGVEFKSYQNLKEVVSIGSQKWLFCHNLSGMLDSQTKTQSEIGLMSLAGHKIDFIVGGHIHATRITDISARSASMAGSNTYNENALGLMGRASQNCYVVRGDDRLIQVNDLQNADNEGYEVVSQLEAYNAKSSGKLKPHTAIMQIVI